MASQLLSGVSLTHVSMANQSLFDYYMKSMLQRHDLAALDLLYRQNAPAIK